jgi:hypothetical protein
MQNAPMTLSHLQLPLGIQNADYGDWCRCVRRLLDWTEGENADWPELFASGHTPRDVARFVVYGDSSGD